MIIENLFIKKNSKALYEIKLGGQPPAMMLPWHAECE
jgi:hypothetical protein